MPSRPNGSLAAAGQVLVDSAARMLGGNSIPSIYVRKMPPVQRSIAMLMLCDVLFVCGHMYALAEQRISSLSAGRWSWATAVSSYRWFVLRVYLSAQ